MIFAYCAAAARATVSSYAQLRFELLDPRLLGGELGLELLAQLLAEHGLGLADTRSQSARLPKGLSKPVVGLALVDAPESNSVGRDQRTASHVEFVLQALTLSIVVVDATDRNGAFNPYYVRSRSVAIFDGDTERCEEFADHRWVSSHQ
jgi:hypothetical protein